MKPPKDYKAEGIEVLTIFDAVRKRPGMYIGGTGPLAWHHMIFQILDDVLKDAMKGNGNTVKVSINGQNCRIAASMSLSVRRNGDQNHLLVREDLYEEANAMYGEIWTGIVRALSSEFSIRVADLEGKKELSFFENTSKDAGCWRIDGDGNYPQYEVEFMPDFDILGAPTTPMWNKALIKERLQIMCGIKEGFRAELHFERDPSETIHMPNGLADLLSYHIPELKNPIRFQGEQGELSYEVAMARHSDHTVISYGNTVQTRSGGDHVRAVQTCCRNAGFDPEDFAFAISVFVPHPSFAQPVKDELISDDIKSFILMDLPEKLKAILAR
ncbi:MAG: hypothetical protein ABJN69_12840 [Hellea sp.]